MIPQELIQRVVRAHDRAVRAAVTAATMPLQSTKLARDRTEEMFEAAMAALIDSQSRG